MTETYPGRSIFPGAPPCERSRQIAAEAARTSCAAVARDRSISRARVKQIVDQIARADEYARLVEAEARLPIGERRIALTSLSTRARCALVNAGFERVGQLIGLAFDHLAVPNLGPVSRHEVIAYIRESAK